MTSNGDFVRAEKRAAVGTEILDVIRDRWSPYAFEPKSVAPEVINQCLVAASWAASSYNEQPWYFLVAYRDDATEFDRMLACLLDANQAWAKFASV